MPADFGAPIANTDPNSGLKTIAGLMSLQQQKQAIESGGLAIQKQQAELPAAQAQAQLTQDKINQQQTFAKQYQTGVDDQGNSLNNANGEPDPAKIIAMQGRLAPLVPEIGKSIMDTHSAKVALQSASQTLGSAERQRLAGPIQAIATNPADPNMVGNASAALDQWAATNPEMQGVVNNAKTLLGHIGNAQTPADRAHMANSMSALLQPGTTVQTQPTAGSVDTGNGVVQGTIAPPVAGGQLTQSSQVGAQLPPTTKVFNPKTNAYEYLGPQPVRTILQGDPEDIMRKLNAIPDPQLRVEAIKGYQNQLATTSGAKLQAEPALGQAGAVAGTVDTMNKDWESTQASAKSAGTDIGLLQNIKKFAAGAVTGVESDRRSYISGLASLTGIDAGTLAKTNTDLLAKNTNMLALAGGDTNLARTMAEGANPNTHMTGAAIQDAANQVIAQRKLALEKQKLLGPVKTLVDRGIATPDVYNSALSKINGIDPRVLQLPDMSTDEKKKLMGAMSPSEQDAFIKMTRDAHALGMGQP
jgi:hypothetical protein